MRLKKKSPIKIVWLWLISTECFSKRLKRLIPWSQCTLVDKASLSLNYFRLEIAVLFLFNLLLSLSASIGPVKFICIRLIPAQILNDAIVGPLPADKAPRCRVLFL